MTLRTFLLSSARAIVATCIVAMSSLGRVAQAQDETPSDTQARALFAEARTAYSEQRFEEAAHTFRRAYLLSPRYGLLYNIGQAELRAGHDALALEAFEAFLRQAPPDDTNRSEVDERARILRSMQTPATATLPTDSTTPPDTSHATVTATQPEPRGAQMTTPPLGVSHPRSDDGPGVAPWLLVGGGAAVAVAGAVLMGLGLSSAADVRNAPDGSRWAELQGDADAASMKWGLGVALAAVGLATAAVGLVWALTGSSSRREASARLRVGVGGLDLEGEF